VKEKTGSSFPSTRRGPAEATDFRHAELREFLRARRRALTPGAVGLPARRRWGFLGLRLQDVAELAQVSTSWYASFELGYAANISARTLTAIALHFSSTIPRRSTSFTFRAHRSRRSPRRITSQSCTSGAYRRDLAPHLR
jgi:transcriptional regulator with XRE-family HTH domain